MALNRLNLTDTKTTAKPVNGKKGGKLNALLSALGSTEQITQQYMNQQVVKKGEKLKEDQIFEAAAVESAVLNKEDLTSLDLKTVTGDTQRNETYASQTVTEQSRNAQQKIAEKGGKVSDSKAIFDAEMFRTLDAEKDPEIKAALEKKYNAMGRQYSQNIAAQEKSDAEENKVMMDTVAVNLANKAPKDPAQAKMWYTNQAKQDMSVLYNEINAQAITEGWNTSEQATELKNAVDRAALSNYKNNPRYAFTLTESYKEFHKKLIKDKGAESAEKAVVLRNYEEQKNALSLISDPYSINFKSKSFTDTLNERISSEEISADNAVASIIVQLQKWNEDGIETPAVVMDYLTNQQPNGTGNLLYKNGSIKNLINKNKSVTEVKKKPQWRELTSYNDYMKKNIENGTLTGEQIDAGVASGLYTDTTAAVKWGDKLIKQTETQMKDLKINKALNSVNPDDFTKISTEFEDKDILNTLNSNLKIATSDGIGGIDSKKVYGLLGGNSVESQKFIHSVVKSGIVPDKMKELFNADTSNMEQFVINYDFMRGLSDTNSQLAFRGSLTQASKDKYDLYGHIIKNDPNTSTEDIKIMLSKSDRVTSDFVAANQLDIDYEKSDFDAEKIKTIENIVNVNGFYDLDFDNTVEIGNVAGKYFNQLSIINPSLDNDSKWEMAQEMLANNYMVLGKTLVSKNTSLSDRTISAEYDEQWEPYLAQIAFEKYNDASRGGELSIAKMPNTDITGVYKIINDGAKVGETKLFESSDGKTPSFKNWADKMQEIKTLGAKKSSLFSDNEYESALKASERDKIPLNEAKMTEYFITSPNFAYEPKPSEVKNGKYSIGGEQIPFLNPNDPNKDDSKDYITRKKIIKESIKRTKQKFQDNKKINKKYTDLFKKSSPDTQAKMVYRYLSRNDKSLTVDTFLEREHEEMKDREQFYKELHKSDPLGDAASDIITNVGNPVAIATAGIGFMYDSYKAFDRLKREVTRKDK